MKNFIYIIKRIAFGRKLMDAYDEASAHDLRVRILNPKSNLDKTP